MSPGLYRDVQRSLGNRFKLVDQPDIAAAKDALKRPRELSLVRSACAVTANAAKQFALAWLERQSRYNLADVSLKATKEGNGWSLSGQKGVVYNAASADTMWLPGAARSGLITRSYRVGPFEL